MTFHFTDPEGRRLELDPDTNLDGQPVVTVRARGHYASVPVHVPLDRVEEVIAGLRDTARQAAGAPLSAGGALTDAERQFLTFALDQAFERMVSGDGFTGEDWAALEKFRRLATEPS